MLYIRFVIGLLLPWITGYLCLRLLEARFSQSKFHPLKQIGYGFFIGWGMFYIVVLISNTWKSGISFPLPAMVTALLILIAIATICLNNGTRPTDNMPRLYSAGFTRLPVRILIGLLLAAILSHTALSVFELLHRPTYPWDAWLLWVYRAKVWFYSGQIHELVTPKEWMQGVTTSLYPISAHDYPKFPSIPPLWAALSLGYWSETLANTPLTCCLVALSAGLYGQCREQGLSPVISTCAVYGLVSMPLVGTHLSLGGYADIWLTGFAGLGFAAIITGLCLGNRFNLVLGFSMVAFGIFVKHEGAAWLYVAFFMLAASTLKWQILLRTLLSALILGGVAYSTGYTYIELPLCGAFGYLDGSIFLPFLGSHELHLYNLWTPYFEAFFNHDSWHLLWVLIILSLVSLFFIVRGRPVRVIASFLLAFALSQFVIFGLTNQGLWAESYTAINRLPLHFVPALLLCIAYCYQQSAKNARTAPASNTSRLITLIGPLIASTMVIWLILQAAGISRAPENNSNGSTFNSHFDPSTMSLVLGEGELKNDTHFINGFNNGMALLSSGPLIVDASDLSLLRYDIEAKTQSQPAFFWRQAASPGDIQVIDIEAERAGSVLLSQQAGWTGKISEIGLIFYGESGESAHVRDIQLSTTTVANFTQALWDSWFSFEPWSQKSINYYRGGRKDSPIALPLLLGIWLLVLCLIQLPLNHRIIQRYRTPASLLGLCILLTWSALDLGWLKNRLRQSVETSRLSNFGGNDPNCFNREDCNMLRIAASIREQLDTDDQRVLIITDKQEPSFLPLRLKYHLLPQPAHYHRGALSKLKTQTDSALVYIGPSAEAMGSLPLGASSLAGRLKLKSQYKPEILWQDSNITLFQISER